MNLLVYAVTVALALWSKKTWPVIAIVAVFFALNFSAYFLLEDGDPRKSMAWLLTPSVVQLGLALAARGFMQWRRERDAILLLAAYQVGSVATLIILLFFGGVRWTWWNWIIVIPASIFQAEIWPLYWLIIRPLFG